MNKPTPLLAAILVVLGLAAAANGAAGVLGGFEADNPDSLGYVLLLLAVLSVVAATTLIVGLTTLARGRPDQRAAQHSRRRWVTVALVVAAGVWPLQALAGSVRRVNLRQAYGAEVTAEQLLDTAPPRALLLTSYYQTGFLIWSARVLDGARPDVDHVHRNYLGQPGYVANLTKRVPRLAALLQGLGKPSDLDYLRLVPEARRRAVLFEFDDDTFGRALIVHSAPLGPLAQMLPPAAQPSPRAPSRLQASVHRWHLLEDRLRTTAEDPLTRMYLLWVSYLNARYHLLRNDCAAARRGYDRALGLGNPRDPTLLKLARDCGF